MDKLIKEINKQKCILDHINRNQNGDYYIIFKLPNVQRGIRGKTKGQVDEVLIVGCPQNKLNNFLENYYKERSKEIA